jgi:TIGR01777 family protein
MVVQPFERRVRLPVDAEEAFAWHERPSALERLTPPWERVEVVERAGEGLRPGTKVRLRTGLGPCAVEWEAEHRLREPGRRFVDVATRGPFARWEHLHEFENAEDGGCWLRDRVDYALPGGAVGRVLAGPWVRRRLKRLFAYRQATTRDDLRFALDHRGAPALRVWVSGASGLIGRSLVPFLRGQGHQVIRLVRREARTSDEIAWDPETGSLGFGAADGVDAVVHLAGAGIAEGRWTPARRREIRESRVRGTALLAAALAALPRPPRVVVGASAIGFYGDAGEAWVDEASAGGGGFLAELTRDWEAAWAPLERTGARRVYLRTGVVLSPAGGALAKMAPLFRAGLGGAVGGGRQWWSWISIDDMVGVIGHALVEETLRGAVNAVAPTPVTNAGFARTLARVLGRPAVLPVPAWALRLVLGRALADETLLASQRVRPAALAAGGYRFRHQNLEAALRHVLGRVS